MLDEFDHDAHDFLLGGLRILTLNGSDHSIHINNSALRRFDGVSDQLLRERIIVVHRSHPGENLSENRKLWRVQFGVDPACSGRSIDELGADVGFELH